MTVQHIASLLVVGIVVGFAAYGTVIAGILVYERRARRRRVARALKPYDAKTTARRSVPSVGCQWLLPDNSLCGGRNSLCGGRVAAEVHGEDQGPLPLCYPHARAFLRSGPWAVVTITPRSDPLLPFIIKAKDSV